MKDHKRVKRYISSSELEGSFEKIIAFLNEQAEELIEPEIVADWGYSGIEGYSVEGWVPMTEKEKEDAARRRRQAREATQRRKERQAEKDREQLDRLAKKLGVEIS